MLGDLESKTKKLEISISEIAEKIQSNEPIELSHVIIKGDLDIVKLKLAKENGLCIVNSQIKITDSEIEGDLAFSEALFKRKIYFKSTQLNGTVDYRGALFVEGADFSGSVFNRDATFGRANFRGDANFFESVFNGNANFNGIYLEGETKFNGSIFNGIVEFTDSRFKEKANFRGSMFNKRAAYFNGSYFYKDANFSRTRFGDIADFNANYYMALNLDESKFYSMRLSKAVFGRDALISLKFSDFVRIDIRWDTIKDKIKYDGTAYSLLVKNFNHLELFDDADNCYYYYRTVRRKEHLNGVRKLLDYFAWMAYGYGVRPVNPLILSLVLFLVSIFVFMSGFGLQEPFNSMLKATYLSVFVFTSSPKTDPLTGLYILWGIIERIAGWLLMACFLVVLAKKTLR